MAPVMALGRARVLEKVSVKAAAPAMTGLGGLEARIPLGSPAPRPHEPGSTGVWAWAVRLARSPGSKEWWPERPGFPR
jgi:hypothetical protein